MSQEMKKDLEAMVGENSHQITQNNNQLTESLNADQGARLGENALFTSGAPPPKGVRYRVEFRQQYSRKVVHSIQTDRPDFEPTDTGEIFDIVTTFSTPDEEFDLSKNSKDQNARKTPRVTDTRKKVEIHIHSPAIIHALRSIVKYYPGQNLLGESIVISEPYAVLVHHEKELNEYRERCRSSGHTHPICPKEKGAYHEIRILQDFLEQVIMPAVRLERERNQNGMETFNMKWLRLKPGSTIKWLDAGSNSWLAGVVEYVKSAGFWGGAGYWAVGYWLLGVGLRGKIPRTA